MTAYTFKKAMTVLDHAIEHLGPTKSCGLFISDGKMSAIPSSSRNADAARAILANAMCQLVRRA